MNRVFEFAGMLMGGELLAYGWQPNAVDPALSSVFPAADKTPWALALGMAVTLGALQRIAHSTRGAGASLLKRKPEIPSQHEKRI